MKKKFEKFEIDPGEINRRVNEILNADLRERKLYMDRKIFKTALIAASITVITAVSAFAMSPTGQETIGNIISYFKNDRAREMTDMAQLTKHNEKINKSVSKAGYTLTLDNVAADDNFIHVFYTIHSDTPFYEGSDPTGKDTIKTCNIECVINGTLAGYGTNHNTYDGYFADNHTFKAARKFNIAALNIPDSFKIELFADIENPDESPVMDKLYKDEYSAITDEDKQNIWYVSADIDKSKVKVESVTRNINTTLPWSGVTVEKAVFSPFGSQLVVSTPPGAEDSVLRVDIMAVFDENDTAIDILNTDLSGGSDGSSTNALEILKADKDTKQLKFVPVNFAKHGDIGSITQKIGTYPLIYKISDYGKVVVTDVRISDGLIEIDYYKDGFVIYDPGFDLLDDNGNNAEPGGKLGCVLYTDVHYDTNSYTARYVYDKLDENGRPVPADESVSAQALKNSFTTLGVSSQSYIELDFDKTVTVDLK